MPASVAEPPALRRGLPGSVTSRSINDRTPVPATYQSPKPALNQPVLRGTHRFDCAVIGGGFTGLSTALHVARSARTVAVVEAREVGWGGSGRAFGQVVPYSKHDESDVLRHFGPEWGERLITNLAAGPELVFSLIDQHSIACEPTRSGLIFAAHARSAEASLARRAEFWKARGVTLGSPRGEAMFEETGSRFYRAGLLEPRGGTVNPLAYARGLARAALSAGAVIHEQSPAIRLDPEGASWRVTTPEGEIIAQHIVIATDAYTDGLWPGLAQSVIPLRAYQVVSAPLPHNMRRLVLPGGRPLSDTRRLYSAVRLRADGRLHLSIPGPVFDAAGVANESAATRRATTLFPDLPPPRWEFAVAGWVGMSADQYPHIHRLADGVIAAIGLSGRGIAIGTLLGVDVSRRVQGLPRTTWMLPDTPLRQIRGWRFSRALVGTLLTSYRARDAIDLSRRR
jgi:glycine/D-amino acid oxidase-like deaminating enzyme